MKKMLRHTASANSSMKPRLRMQVRLLKCSLFFLALSTIILVSTSIAIAQEQGSNPNLDRHAQLQVTLQEPALLGVAYTSLFRIDNLNYSKDYDSRINITVHYTLARQGTFVLESSFSKMVNSYATAGTGYVFFSELGDYELCGSSSISNSACKKIKVISPMDVACRAGIGLTLQRTLFFEGEKVEIRNMLDFEGGVKHPFIIQYWVEDSKGMDVKKRLNTSNLEPKSFTPSIAGDEELFAAKNLLLYVGCNNSVQAFESSQSFIVRKPLVIIQPVETLEPGTLQEAKTSPAAVSNSSILASETIISSPVKGAILSFYTRAKNYNDSINLFSNLNSKYGGTVLVKGEFGEKILTVDGSEKNQQYSFNVKAQPGENKFAIELYELGELSDSRVLAATLAGSKKELAKNSSAEYLNSSLKTVQGNNSLITGNALAPPSSLLTKGNSNITISERAAQATATASNVASQKNLAGSDPLDSEAMQQSPANTGIAVFESAKAKSKLLTPIIAAAAAGLAAAAILSRKWR